MTARNCAVIVRLLCGNSAVRAGKVKTENEKLKTENGKLKTKRGKRAK